MGECTCICVLCTVGTGRRKETKVERIRFCVLVVGQERLSWGRSERVRRDVMTVGRGGRRTKRRVSLGENMEDGTTYHWS